VALTHLKRAAKLAPLPLDAAGTGSGTPGLRDAVRAAFAALPPKLRAVAALALVEGRQYDEIGAALGISAAAVKSREFRAVRLLRRQLAQQGYLP
jgi:RNA polymerase sigma-70 factor (ECF subfamily)